MLPVTAEQPCSRLDAMRVEIKSAKVKGFLQKVANDYFATGGTVGVHGEDDSRTDGESNVDIGAAHFYGIGVPQRDWLVRPLEERLNEFKGMLNESVQIGIPAGKNGMAKLIVHNAERFLKQNLKERKTAYKQLAEETLKMRKDPSTPILIEEGEFVESIKGKLDD